MTAFPQIEAIRDRFQTHRSNRSSSAPKESALQVGPMRAQRHCVKMNSRPIRAHGAVPVPDGCEWD
jgi:hypothetical protein